MAGVTVPFTVVHVSHIFASKNHSIYNMYSTDSFLSFTLLTKQLQLNISINILLLLALFLA